VHCQPPAVLPLDTSLPRGLPQARRRLRSDPHEPPWERIKLQEKEWFAARSPKIAEAPNAAARKRMIAALEKNDPPLTISKTGTNCFQPGWQSVCVRSRCHASLVRG
jgi:hypothetical protein